VVVVSVLPPECRIRRHQPDDDGEGEAGVAQARGGAEDSVEAGQQGRVDQPAREELRQDAPQGAVDQAFAGQEQGQRDQEPRMDAEMAQQRLGDDAAQKQVIPRRPQRERQPRDPDRKGDA